MDAASEKDDDERRRYPRIKVLSRIAVIYLPEIRNAVGGPESNWHLTVDVSRDGVRFKSLQDLAKGSFVRIDVVRRRPHANITLAGIVRWVRRVDKEMYYDIGVELLDTRDVNREAWLQYIEERTARGPIATATDAGNRPF